MNASATARASSGWVLAALTLLVVASPARSQILPWEITVAEVEAGRLRSLVQRLSKQNLLYQLQLGDTRKLDLVETAIQIDRILESLSRGSPSYSIPAPWTPALREHIDRVDEVWGPLRRVAVASAFDAFRVRRQFVPADIRLGDPQLLRFFERASSDLIASSERLLALYHSECQATGLEVCTMARTAGYSAMLIERATQEAVYLVAGIEVDRNRVRLKATVEAYEKQRSANNESPFMAAALNPERGISAAAAGDLLESLRKDWDMMRREFALLGAGDEQNFDPRNLLRTQTRLVDKVERLTAALLRYASLTYGS